MRVIRISIANLQMRIQGQVVVDLLSSYLAMKPYGS